MHIGAGQQGFEFLPRKISQVAELRMLRGVAARFALGGLGNEVAIFASVSVGPMPMPHGTPVHCRMRSRTRWLRCVISPRMPVKSRKLSSMEWTFWRWPRPAAKLIMRSDMSPYSAKLALSATRPALSCKCRIWNQGATMATSTSVQPPVTAFSVQRQDGHAGH